MDASTTDRFYMQRGTVRFGKFSIIFLALLGLAVLWFGLANLDSGGIGLFFLLAGLFFLGMAYYTWKKGAGTRKFVELSAAGINLNDEKRIAWTDIEQVEEQDYEQDFKYVSVKKKKLVISYANRAKGHIERAEIISDFEGYPILKARVLAESHKG